jgi:hypothetical protein
VSPRTPRSITNNMPAPPGPVFLSGPQNATETVLPPPPPQQQAGQNHWSPSAGSWVGLSIFIVLAVIFVARYSYLALPEGMRRRMKERLRLDSGPGHQIPISRPPIPRSQAEAVDVQVSGPVAPPETGIQIDRSRDTLPLYRPTPNSSSDFLQAVVGLRVPGSSSHPPSYRSRLSLPWGSPRDSPIR